MKKQFINAIEKKLFTFFVALVILFCSSVRLYAHEGNTGSGNALVAYKGLKDKLLVFKVDYKNELNQSFDLVIKNDQSEIVFIKKFEAQPLHSDVLLSDVPENCKLTFSIVSGKKVFSQSFEINKQVKLVEEVEVKGI